MVRFECINLKMGAGEVVHTRASIQELRNVRALLKVKMTCFMNYSFIWHRLMEIKIYTVFGIHDVWLRLMYAAEY